MKAIYLFWGLLLFAGCATTSQLEYDEQKAYDARNYALSAKLIDYKIETEEYKEKDEVLYSLELGSIYHLQGDYEASNRHFSNAEQAIEDNYTKSVSRGVGAFISNDNALVYDGEPYEDTYLNAFKALNYMHRDDLQGALVEARRIAHKLEQTAIRAKGLAEVIGNGDNKVIKMVGKDKLNYELGELTVQDSPFSHYLSAVLLAKTDKPDDARIEFSRFKDAVDLHATQLQQNGLTEAVDSTITEPESYNTVLVGFSGRAPKKVGKKNNFLVPVANVDVVYAYPEIEIYRPVTQRIEVTVNGETTVEVPIVEHMDLVSAEVFNHKLPIVKSRALLRGVGKGVVKGVVGNQVKKRLGSTAGMVFDVLGSAAQDASEQADVRAWNSLPGKVHASVLDLEPGVHTLEWNYYDSAGRLRFTDTEEVEIAEGKPLTLVQSEYIR